MRVAVCLLLWAAPLRAEGLADLVVPNARPEKLASGFQFVEGPVWHPNGFLLFSDIPANTIYKWTPQNGAQIFRAGSGQSNGLALDKKGRLLVCEGRNRRVSRTDARGGVETVALQWENKRLNSPNDIVVAKNGAVYFSDPTYGLKKSEAQLPFRGVFRLDSNGKLTLLDRTWQQPNGLTISPDQKVLYVGDSQEGTLWVFKILPSGNLAKRRLFAKMDGPDGMKCDQKGNLWVAGVGGVQIFAPTGQFLGKIALEGAPATNLCFGGENGQTLFVTAGKTLWRVATKTRGTF